MDFPSTEPWLFDIDSIFFHDFETSYLGHESHPAIPGDDDHDMDHYSLSSASNSSSTITSRFNIKNITASAAAAASSSTELPHQVAWKAKQHKSHSHATGATTVLNASTTEVPLSSPIVLDFSSGSAIPAADYMLKDPLQKSMLEKDEEDDDDRRTRKRKASRSVGGQCWDDRIIAERIRREKLSQKFIALSAIVPGLKKMDKTSVLEEAINLIKHLQERLVTLEAENAKRAVESVVTVKKSRVVVGVDDRHYSLSNQNFLANDDNFPEIEVKFSDKTVLLRIHCEKRKGLLVKLLSEIEKLHLFIINVHAVPFSNSTLEITIISQMELEFNMTPPDTAKYLHLVLQQS
ncbi:hypothetical protein Ancab_026181 [Ancistrocladus abbreviatus]